VSNSTDSEEFKKWVEYEKIAMHFNELIIQLRVRALAGVGAVSVLVGFMSKVSPTGEYNWGLLFVALVALTIAWFAILVLDLFYYNRLLSGSVNAVLEVEKASSSNLDMSTKIANEVSSSCIDGRYWFYGIVLFTLIIGIYLTYPKIQ